MTSQQTANEAPRHLAGEQKQPRDRISVGCLLQLPHSGRIRPNLVPRIGGHVMRDYWIALVVTFIGSFIVGVLI